MAVDCNKQVLGLEVAVDDVLLVDVVEADEYLEEVELGLSFGHLLDLFQLVEELSAGAIWVRKRVHSIMKAKWFLV